MRSQERKNVVLGKLLRKKNQKGARVWINSLNIDPSGHFVFCENLCSSNSFFHLFRKVEIQIFLFIFNSSVILIDKFHNRPPGEPREHHLVEVLQGRSKFKINTTLSYWTALLPWSKLSRNKKKSYFKIPSFNVSKYPNSKLSNFLKFFYFLHLYLHWALRLGVAQKLSKHKNS